MPGLDHADTAQLAAVAVSRNGNAAQPLGRNSLPVEIVRLGNFGHGPGGLAGGEHDQLASGYRGQQRRKTRGGVSGSDRGLKKIREKCAMGQGHAVRGRNRIGARSASTDSTKLCTSVEFICEAPLHEMKAVAHLLFIPSSVA